MELTDIGVIVLADLAVPWETLHLVPIGDIQLGAPGCDLDRRKADVVWGLDHNAMYIGMGDMVDVASPSNRQALRTVKLYDAVQEALMSPVEFGGVRIHIQPTHTAAQDYINFTVEV